MLSGDIVRGTSFGEWEEGKTEFTGDMLGANSAQILSFSKDPERVLGYGGMKPSPKRGYDTFENQPQRVKFQVETTGKGMVDISSKSHYKVEQEAVAKTSSKFVYMGAEYKQSGAFWIIKLKEV